MTTRTATRFHSPASGMLEGVFVTPDDATGRLPGVLVIHEIFGMQEVMLELADRFAREGYVAFVPDLFTRPTPKPLCVARAMRTLVSGEGPMIDDLDAARAALASRADVDPTRLAVAGFCMGGGFTLLLAARGGFKAAAPFYGMVPPKAEALRGICPVVGSFGERDPMFAKQGRILEKHLTVLDVPHDVKIYPEAGHAFMSSAPEGVFQTMVEGLPPLRTGHVPEAAEDAWRRMLGFFATHLG